LSKEDDRAPEEERVDRVQPPQLMPVRAKEDASALEGASWDGRRDHAMGGSPLHALTRRR
jgi:hypothetical protein